MYTHIIFIYMCVRKRNDERKRKHTKDVGGRVGIFQNIFNFPQNIDLIHAQPPNWGHGSNTGQRNSYPKFLFFLSFLDL